MATRKPTAALGWFPHTAVTDSAIIDMATASQIALRARLRNHYWVTDGKPIGEATVQLIQKKMVMLDPKDRMSLEQVTELLSDHYGFFEVPGGWAILDLDEARGVAVDAIQRIRDRAAEGGRAKAEKAREAKGAAALASGTSEPGLPAQLPAPIDLDDF